MYTTTKGYTLCIIQRSLPPNMVPTQTLCIIRFIHYDNMHYVKVYCSEFAFAQPEALSDKEDLLQVQIPNKVSHLAYQQAIAGFQDLH